MVSYASAQMILVYLSTASLYFKYRNSNLLQGGSLTIRLKKRRTNENYIVPGRQK